MPVTQSNLSSVDIVNGLQESGLCRGDLVYLQVADTAFGMMDSSLFEIERCELLLNAIREVIGQEGSLFVPAFSLSFLRNEAFDPDHTPAVGGEWNTSVGFSEYIRCQPGVVRSVDPNFSVCGLGPQAGRILSDLPATTNGPGCFYERIMRAAGKICCIGTGAVCTSFLHYAEETLDVPYRYKKLFTGSIRRGGETVSRGGFQASLSTQRMELSMEPVWPPLPGRKEGFASQQDTPARSRPSPARACTSCSTVR